MTDSFTHFNIDPLPFCGCTSERCVTISWRSRPISSQSANTGRRLYDWKEPTTGKLAVTQDSPEHTSKEIPSIFALTERTNTSADFFFAENETARARVISEIHWEITASSALYRHLQQESARRIFSAAYSWKEEKFATWFFETPNTIPTSGLATSRRERISPGWSMPYSSTRYFGYFLS